ncbi:RHOMBOID-like protein 1 [Dichanthelium oligosanthes]|uniref:RHOMBOID-like protein n=1 Tax=Dichanthelium oligosanthes TaxID=888268 RepID=A0A1E5VS00_9POAL|nr:RHOMBOID-like protein 1 [Dichanthelium oligosanthes]
MPRRGETAVVPIDEAGGGGGERGGGQERPKGERHRGHGPGHHGRHGPGHQQRRSRPPPPPPPVFRPFRRWFPFLVPLFIVANIALFVLTMYVNDCPAHAQATGAAIGGSVGESATAQGCWLAPELGRFAFQSFKENPLVGPSSATLLKLGALETSKVTKDHEGWRLITCIWLHAGVIHILANMLSLVLIGIRLEKEFGFMRIGTLYVISGVGGSLLSSLFMVSNISVGASGALFGLLGSMLSELITNWTIYENKIAALLTLVMIIVINLAVGILPHVDNFAHLGGFTSGFFLGFVLLMRPQFGYINQKNSPLEYPMGVTKRKFKIYQIILFVIATVILVTGFTVGLVFLFHGFNASEHCSWCHYLSCVPTSKWSCKAPNNYCMSSQLGSQLNLTCQGTGKSATYVLNNPNSTEAIKNLCVGLCS